MRGASVLSLVQCAGVLLLLLRPAAIAARQPHKRNNNLQQLRQRDLRKDNAEWVHVNGDSRKRDVVVQTICEAKCWRQLNLHHCIKSCYSRNWDKPGSCPSLIQINDHSTNYPTTSSPTPFYLPCLNDCKKDADCNGLQKCCKHHCGNTCQPAQNLQNISGLLPIPTELHIKPRKKKALYIKWKPSTPFVNINQPIFYILQQRQQQFGKFDNDLLFLGEWTTPMRTAKSSILLRNFIQPGRWYQFRIASVNENGTRGFSQPITYTGTGNSRPPKAPDVIVGPLRQQNGTLMIDLSWVRPQFEAGIVKYKVFWSKRLYGISALDSVLVLQHRIPGDMSKYTIQDLDPDSMYFIQVQAIAQVGNQVLRGEKSGYVLNTTNYINITQSTMSNISTIAITKINNLQLEKLYWSKDENDLKARFTWKPDGRNIKYNINWWASCKNQKNSQHKLTATTRHPHFDIYDLHFDCRYKVNVKETNHSHRSRIHAESNSGEHGDRHFRKRIFYETSVTFTTPSCRGMQPRYKRLKCKNRN